MKTMPCGYKRTGKLKEHLAHYRQCSHPACQARLVAFDDMSKLFSREMAKQQAKASKH